MAIFNFNGRQRKHEIELANLSHQNRMRELDASLRANAYEGEAERELRRSEGSANRDLTRAEGEAEREFRRSEGSANRDLTRGEGKEERALRRSEGAANRELTREEGGAERRARALEGSENRKLTRGENAKARRHATKSQKLNFKLGDASYERHKRIDAQVANETAALDSLKRRRALELAGASNGEVAEAEMMYEPALSNAAKARFERLKLGGRDPVTEGQDEAGAERWRNRGIAAQGMAAWEQGTAALPYLEGQTRSEMELNIARNKANRELIEKNPAAAVTAIYGADARAAALDRSKIRPERRASLRAQPVAITSDFPTD